MRGQTVYARKSAQVDRTLSPHKCCASMSVDPWQKACGTYGGNGCNPCVRSQTKEVLMAKARRYTAVMLAIVGCLGLSALPTRAADPAPITDGSKVTLLYQIKVPGDERIEVRDLSQFIQGKHQMLPALEQAVSGMRRGDKTEVKLSEDQAFGAYDSKKKTVVPTKELPSGVKTGDIIEDR